MATKTYMCIKIEMTTEQALMLESEYEKVDAAFAAVVGFKVKIISMQKVDDKI